MSNKPRITIKAGDTSTLVALFKKADDNNRDENGQPYKQIQIMRPQHDGKEAARHLKMGE